ncbi:nucleotidyltransferase family protein [Paenibacillus chitinolyticus]|uniref:nucleotidyltransferase family protein n=1 Tax=Paenibacillus chitinolyticus TaxID=79263 RepID=UPI003D07BC1D
MTQPLIRFMNDLYVVHGAFSFTEEEYGQIAEDLDLFSITAQVYHMLKEKGRLGELPLFLQDHLKRKAEATLFQNLLLKTETDRLLRLFEEAGLQILLMKGIYFSERYYGGFGVRGTTDIDLLIQPENLSAAAAIVETLGFERFDESDASHHVVYTREGAAGRLPITVEIHWGLVEFRTADIDYDLFWSQSLPLQNYVHIRRMSDSDTFYSICLHGSQHRMNSIRYFLDVVHLLQNADVESVRKGVVQRAAREYTVKRMKTVLAAVDYLFPGLPVIVPVRPSVPPLWSYSLIRSVQQGHKGSWNTLYILLYHLTQVYDRSAHTGAWFCNFLFPYVHPALLGLEGVRSASRWKHFKSVYAERWKRLTRHVKMKKYV